MLLKPCFGWASSNLDSLAGSMLLRAFAKINLDLRVLGHREDGYHEVRTILQAIDWWDEIHLEPANRFEFSAPGTPEDETNLVVRAVRAYERLARLTANVRIKVTKNIPIGRGFGGGSADAAVTFMGLQRLFKRALPFQEIPMVLRSLGSDVPFFTLGGRAAGFGRGDESPGLFALPRTGDDQGPTVEVWRGSSSAFGQRLCGIRSISDDIGCHSRWIGPGRAFSCEADKTIAALGVFPENGGRRIDFELQISRQGLSQFEF